MLMLESSPKGLPASQQASISDAGGVVKCPTSYHLVIWQKWTRRKRSADTDSVTGTMYGKGANMTDNAETEIMAAEITKLKYIIDDMDAEIARLNATLDEIIAYRIWNSRVTAEQHVHRIQSIARDAKIDG
jgi:hypothetical protein